MGGWSFNNSRIEDERVSIISDQIIKNGDIYICLNTKSFSLPNNIAAQSEGDYILKITENDIEIFVLNSSEAEMIFDSEVNLKDGGSNRKIKKLSCLPGEKYSLILDK